MDSLSLEIKVFFNLLIFLFVWLCYTLQDNENRYIKRCHFETIFKTLPLVGRNMLECVQTTFCAAEHKGSSK